VNDAEYSKIWVDVHIALRGAVEEELARQCAAKLGRVGVHGLLGGSSQGLSERIQELSDNLRNKDAEISVLYRAIVVLAASARLGNELSEYAAASELENTPEFLEGLIEQCQGVQDAYRRVDDNLVAAAAVKITQGGAEAGGDARPTGGGAEGGGVA
jgi:hypothetical protein